MSTGQFKNHKPGRRPVDGEIIVVCVLRDGSITMPSRADEMIWNHTWHAKEIIGYREFLPVHSHAGGDQ